jgi:hypothetical protein
MGGLSEIRRPMKDLRTCELARVMSYLYTGQNHYRYYWNNLKITCGHNLCRRDEMDRSGTIGKKNWIIFYSCDSKEHKLGTGFVIHKEVKHLIMNFQPDPSGCAG